MKQKQFETEWKKYKLELEKKRKELEDSRKEVDQTTYSKKVDQNETKTTVQTGTETEKENC